MTRVNRGVLTALAAAVVIAAAAALWHSLPLNTQIYAPFDVDGPVGAPLTGRNVTATVSDVRIGPTVRDEEARPPSYAALGVWVVVTAAVAAVQTPDLLWTRLQVGADTYEPTSRLPVSTQLDRQMSPGIQRRGALVFDVAPEALDAVDEVTLLVWLGDARLDSRLRFTIPLSGADRTRIIDIDRPVVSAA
jgi:hypothetical protein